MKKITDLTVKQLKTRRRMLEALSFLLSVLPVSVAIITRWDVYTEDPGGGFKLAIGGILLGVVLLLGVLGRLKIPGDIWVAVFVFVISYLIRSVLDDILLLTGCYIAGRVCDRLFCKGAIKRIREELAARRTAELTGKTVVDQIKSYLGGSAV